MSVGSDPRMCGFAIFPLLSTNRPRQRVRSAQQFDDRPSVVSHAERLGAAADEGVDLVIGDAAVPTVGVGTRVPGCVDPFTAATRAFDL